MLIIRRQPSTANPHQSVLFTVHCLLFTPILARLGHTWEGQATISGLGGGIKKPDFVFFPDEAARHAAVTAQNTAAYAERALAVGEVKAWEVNLSKKTGGRPTVRLSR